MIEEARLPRGKVIQFFAADVAKGLFNGMIGNYLLYFYQPTSDSGIIQLLQTNKLFGFITIMALLTGLSKIVDAITDPLVASWSDRCKSKLGRRMPFLRWAALPYALSVLMVFFAPFEPGSVLNSVWVGIFLILYYVFYTLYFIPHRALVPEIIPDPKQRVGYYGISTAFFMGTSAIMYMASLFVDGLKKAGLEPIWAWRTIFTIFAVVGGACLLISAFAFNEKKYVMNSKPPEESIFKSFAIVFKNKNFVIFTFADLFNYVSMAFFQTAMMYYITVLINVEEKNAFVVMLAAIVTALICFPIIIKVSSKYNKRVPLIVANAMFAVLFTCIYFGDNIAALMPGYELVLGIMMGILVAYPFAAINILPQSVLADIIQADSIKSGVNREGIYSAIKTFIEKIASAIALVVVSSVIAIGAVDGKNVGLQGVKLTGLIAGVFCLLSMIFFIIYKDKDVMNIINEKMGKKELPKGDSYKCKRRKGVDSMCTILNAVRMKKKKYTKDEPNINVGDAKLEEYVARLQRMIQCKTVSDKDPDPNEFAKFRDVIREEFPLLHSKAELITFDGALVFKVSATKPTDRNIILMSHHDVVQTPGDWKYPPFGAEVHDGYMYGRGTIDTKTPLFAELQSVEELLSEGFEFKVNVYIASSNNEEICGEGIVKAVNYFKENNIHFEMCMDEGGAIVDKQVPGVVEKTAMIAVHEKGRHTFECVAKKDAGKGHNGLTGGKIDNPVERMSAFVQEASKLKFKMKLYPEVRAMFEACAPNMSFGYRYLFSNLWLFGKPLVKLLPKINGQVAAMLGTTFTFTQIESTGGSDQVRPEEVKVDAFFRCVRDTDLERDVAIFSEVAKKYGVEVTPKVVDYCKVADFENDTFAYIKDTIKTHFPNVVVAPFLLTAGTDARRLTDVADNIYRFAPISMSREQFKTVHSPNENIGVSSIGECVLFYKDIVKNYK